MIIIFLSESNLLFLSLFYFLSGHCHTYTQKVLSQCTLLINKDSMGQT